MASDLCVGHHRTLGGKETLILNFMDIRLLKFQNDVYRFNLLVVWGYHYSVWLWAIKSWMCRISVFCLCYSIGQKMKFIGPTHVIKCILLTSTDRSCLIINKLRVYLRVVSYCKFTSLISIVLGKILSSIHITGYLICSAVHTAPNVFYTVVDLCSSTKDSLVQPTQLFKLMRTCVM